MRRLPAPPSPHPNRLSLTPTDSRATGSPLDRLLAPLLRTAGSVTRRGRRPGPRHRRRLGGEALEARRVLASYIVTTPDDVVADDGLVSLREAIEAVNTGAAVNEAVAGDPVGNLITFDLPVGSETITLAGGELVITGDVTIDGANLDGSGVPITIDAAEMNRAMRIDSADSVTLVQLTVTGGVADIGGGIAVAGGGVVTLDGVDVRGNRATVAGGGIANTASTLRIDPLSSVSANELDVAGEGGGVWSSGGQLIINESSLEDNDGAAILIVNGSGDLASISFSGNVAEDLVVRTTPGDDAITVTPTEITFDAESIAFDESLATLLLDAAGGDDTITVTPSEFLAITVDGGDHDSPAGDLLSVVGDLTKLITGPNEGQLVAPDVEPVTFLNVERVRAETGGSLSDFYQLPDNGTPNHVRVSLDPSGDWLQVFFDPDGPGPMPEELVSSQLVSSVVAIEIIGSDDDDHLTVDTTNGDPLAGLDSFLFDGRDQATPTGDGLTLIGGAATSIRYDFANATDGTIDIDGAILEFRGLEPIFDNLDATDRVFAFSDVGQTITLGDDANPGDNISRIESTLAETVFFTNPTNSLTILAGSGDDVVILEAPDSLTSIPILNVDLGDGNDSFDGSAVPAGFYAAVTIDGGAGDDTILGTQGPDTINGGDGNDFIVGNGGDDVLNGGGGDDTFVWNDGDGNDVIDGGDGDDTFVFNGNDGGNDVITLQPTLTGYEIVRTAPAAVTIRVDGIETQQINTLGGDDEVTVEDLGAFAPAVISIDGGDGADTLTVNGSDDVADGDEITVRATATGYELERFQPDPLLIRAESVETLEVNTLAGDDQVTVEDLGAFAPDVLTIDGGDGDDLIDASLLPAGTVGTVTIEGGAGNDTLIGSQGDDTINGGDGDDFIIGNGGDDVLNGGGGDDTFVWNDGDGNDVIDGGDGNDTFIFNGSDGNDDVIALQPTLTGYEVVRTAPAAVTITVDRIETQEINTLAGDDQVIVEDLGAFAPDVLTIDGGDGDDLIDASLLLAGTVGTVTIEGGAGNDTLIGSQGDDTINGGDGDDFIIGNGGDDVLNGGGGDDTFVWNDGDGNDVIDGGDGNDTFIFNGADGFSDVITLANTATGYELTRTAPAAVMITVDGVENQRINTFAGDDEITVDLPDPTTLDQLVVNAGDGNDTIRVLGWGGTNGAELNGEEGVDTFIIGSADGPTGTLDRITAAITIDGGGTPAGGTVSESVEGRTTEGVVESIEVEVPDPSAHDFLFVNDAGSVAPHTFLVTGTTVQRTSPAGGLISYAAIESVVLSTGEGDDTVTVDGTADGAMTVVSTADGDDTVNVNQTGIASILFVDAGDGENAVTVSGTGDESVTRVNTGDDADSVTVTSVGDLAGLEINTAGGDDTITLGPEPSPPTRSGPAVIRVNAGAGADTFDVEEVFLNAVVDLVGGAGADTFNLTAAGSTAEGSLSRLNDDPGNDPDDVTVTVTRQLFIEGGDSVETGPGRIPIVNEGARIDTLGDGVPVMPPYTAGSRLMTSAPCDPAGIDFPIAGPGDPLASNDTINLIASDAVDPLDLRLLITAFGAGVLATVDNADPGAPANEIVEFVGIESVHVEAGSGNDTMTVHSDVAITAPTTGIVVSFDGGNGDDLFRVVGTDFDDRITIRSPIAAGSPRAPFEIDDVEFVRVDGFGGDDQIVNKTPAQGVLNGGDGNDILVGGSDSDLITGGAGIDALFGCEGNDILLPDHNFGDSAPDPMIATDGELIDGGPEDSLSPGDVAIQLGEDFVNDIESLGDGGGLKNVLTWIRAIFIPLDSISFDGSSPLVEAFGRALSDPPDLNRDNLFDETDGVVTPPPTQGNATPSMLMTIHNDVLPGDVNGDGAVTALDALIVINHLARDQAGTLGEGEPSFSYNFPDVNNDGRVTALDALLVINTLQTRPTSLEPREPEAEAASESDRDATSHRIALAGTDSTETEMPHTVRPVAQTSRHAPGDESDDTGWLDLLADDLARLGSDRLS